MLQPSMQSYLFHSLQTYLFHNIHAVLPLPHPVWRLTFATTSSLNFATPSTQSYCFHILRTYLCHNLRNYVFAPTSRPTFARNLQTYLSRPSKLTYATISRPIFLHTLQTYLCCNLNTFETTPGLPLPQPPVLPWPKPLDLL
jgi:hypothetical protein